MNLFRLFFAFRLEMRVRSDNQYKTGADGGSISGQPRLFECMGICVLSPAHESEMRAYLVYVPIVKYRFCLNSATVYEIGRPFRGFVVVVVVDFLKHFRGVCGPCHL